MTVKPKVVRAKPSPSAQINSDAPIPGFVQSSPILMMPVRIETRYVDGGNELRIRVYPDQIHLDLHDPVLQAAEEVAGQWYWQQRWSAPSPDVEDALAREALAMLERTFGQPRARWIVSQMVPANLSMAPRNSAPRFPVGSTRPDGWQRAARLSLLPDRWIASAFANDAKGNLIRVFEKAGKAIEPSLNASPDPASTSDDPKFRWTTDFGEAERVGMAMRLRVNDLDETARAKGIGITSALARLIVWGWRTGDSATQLETLMTAHAHSQGLSFPLPGTPTNLTGDAVSLAVEHTNPVDNALAITTGRRVTAASGEDIAGRMTDLIWNATLGQTLDQLGDPLIGDAVIDVLREHARKWVRPDGPLPVIRVGRQPYGVLPVIVSKRFKGVSVLDTRLNEILQQLRPFWMAASGRAPKLDRGGNSLVQNLDALLRQGPLAQTVRFRRVLGPRVAELTGFSAAMRALLNATTASVLQKAGIAGVPRLAAMVAEDEALALDLPWVEAAESHLPALAASARATDARSRLVSRDAPDNVLELLAVQALIYEIDKDAAAHAHQVIQSRGLSEAMPPTIALRIEELVNLGPTPAPKGRITTGAALASLRLGKRILPPSQGLQATLAALDALSNRPASELDRALRGWLDACSWRLDAWITSLATRRLAEGHSKPGSKVVQVGAYGWVENLAPDTRPDSEGFIHAPSMHHAQTAAVLGSGHLAHRGDTGDAFAINLSSRRVRQAKALLDAVAQGIPLGESLGIRFEALLRQRDPRLVKHISPLRARFAASAIAPLDGVALLDDHRDRPDWLSRALPDATASERNLIDSCAAQLEEVFDAVSDLLLAEGVHQIAGGNMARAATAFSALDRQTQPPETEVARTPGSGTGFDQRVVLILGSARPAKAWQALSNDGRAIAEPALNAWAADRIGDPARFAIAAVAIDRSPRQERSLTPVSLIDLGLSPLSLIMLSAHRPQDSDTLRDRVSAAFAVQLSPEELASGTSIRIEPDPPRAAELGFAELEALLISLAGAVGAGRALAPADLTTGTPSVQIDLLQLTARANQVHDLFKVARQTLAQAIAMQVHLEEAIATAAHAGAAIRSTPEANPLSVAKAALAGVDEALARDAAITPSRSDAEAVDQLIARIRALLGNDFPVLPVFDGTASDFSDLWASLADQRALLAGASLPVQSVLRQMRRVRPALSGLADAIEASELVQGKAAPFAVAQLPHRAAARWIGLPYGDAPPQGVKASLMIHANSINPAHQLALISGLLIDSWTEVIPERVARTGVAMHYDAPAVRAPQSLLLAVHPESAAADWTPAILFDTIAEALDLARIRAVRPQDLPPMGMALPLIYLPENATGDVPATNLHAIRDRAAKRARQRAGS